MEELEDFGSWKELVIKPRLHIQQGDEHHFIIPEFEVPICLYQVDKEEEVQIGVIRANRFDLSHSTDTLTFLADELEHDLYRMAEFLSTNEEVQFPIEYHHYLFHIGQVYVQPEHRGQDYGLKALAMFLELFALGQMVSCYPYPDPDITKKFSAERGKKLLKRYWSKVGLTNYNAEHNVLWQAEWDVPQYLKTIK